jgi:hypothetical protein
MNKTIAAACVGLILAASAAPALARVKHHRQVNPAPVAHGRINSGWGPPMNWNEIEVSHPRAAAEPRRAINNYQGADPPWTFACIKDHGTSRCNDLN